MTLLLADCPPGGVFRPLAPVDARATSVVTGFFPETVEEVAAAIGVEIRVMRPPVLTVGARDW